MLFMTNEPAKNKKLFWRHEIQQGLGVRPGAPVQSKFFLSNIIFLHFCNFALIEICTYVFFCLFFTLFSTCASMKQPLKNS